MKSEIAKPISATLCAALMVCSIGASAYAEKVPEQEEKPVLSETVVTDPTQAEIVKDETVYVIAGADGSVQKIIVSDWIKNSLGKAEIHDRSELKDAENVKGDETYTMNGDNMRVWDAQGNDIYYQGNMEKELPVSLAVSYQLDGRNISPNELPGKSGKIQIRYTYTNNQYEMVEIDGKQEKLYVPFAMLTGMLLDNDVFTNVEVSNGKLINDGNHTAVVGIAFPGMQSNLAIAKDKFEVPDYVEITADVKNFKLANTVTVATNEIFNRLDPEKMNSADGLTGSFVELTKAMDQLMDGSSQLYNGLCTLLDKSGTLVDGIDQLASGASKLKDGTESLSSGTSELANGVKSLASGLAELTANNNSLNAGSKQVFESLLNMANTQLAAAGIEIPKLTIDNYAKVLNGVIASLDKDNIAQQAQAVAREKVTAAVNAQKDTVKAAVTEQVQAEVRAQVTAAVRENVKAQVLAAMGLTADTIPEEQKAAIEAAVDAKLQEAAAQTAIAENTAGKMQSAEIQSLISAKTEEQIQVLIEQNMNSPEVQNQITEALKQAASGAAEISSLKASLDSYHTFYAGLNQYTAGVAAAKKGADQLNAGAAKLKSGASELNSGMSTLYNGIHELSSGAPALKGGVTELRDGAMKLSDGLKEFNEKGVQKLIDAVDGDLGGLLTRVRATINVSKNYQSFSGISDDMDGQVKFIYRTDAIDVE